MTPTTPLTMSAGRFANIERYCGNGNCDNEDATELLNEVHALRAALDKAEDECAVHRQSLKQMAFELREAEADTKRLDTAERYWENRRSWLDLRDHTGPGSLRHALDAAPASEKEEG